MVSSPVLELLNICKSFSCANESIEILRSISLKVYRGDKIAIVGPSGVGKTTLLNIMGCLDTPTKGELLFEGKKVDWKNEHQLNAIRKEKVGFIFQLHYLIFEVSVLENAILQGLINGVPKRELVKRAEELFEFLGLKEKMHFTPDVLSGGERQKVAVARALVNQPALVLADEPTGNLDPASANEVVAKFLELSSKFGTAVVMVTHNLELAKKMDKIFLLKRGFLVELDKTLLKEDVVLEERP